MRLDHQTHTALLTHLVILLPINHPPTNSLTTHPHTPTHPSPTLPHPTSHSHSHTSSFTHTPPLAHTPTPHPSPTLPHLTPHPHLTSRPHSHTSPLTHTHPHTTPCSHTRGFHIFILQSLAVLEDITNPLLSLTSCHTWYTDQTVLNELLCQFSR